MERILGIDRQAALPKFSWRTFVMRANQTALEVDRTAPAVGRKAVLYATCFVNYKPEHRRGEATRAVLARNGVETEVIHPRCCGMPQLEQGDLTAVAASAAKVSTVLGPWMDKATTSWHWFRLAG